MSSSALNDALYYLADKGIKAKNLDFAVVSGSGLAQNISEFADVIDRYDYKAIAGFPQTSVSGHAGELLIVKFRNSNGLALVFSGRIHLYEGVALDNILFQVRLTNLLKIKRIIITCAVGSINRFSLPGSIGIISDHLDMQQRGVVHGRSSLNTRIYDADLMDILYKTAITYGIAANKGVLCSVLGPTYETPAEAAMLRSFGADWMSMSTVKEAAEAHRLGMKVAGIVGVTNYVNAQEVTHQEVISAARICSKKLWKLLSHVTE